MSRPTRRPLATAALLLVAIVFAAQATASEAVIAEDAMASATDATATSVPDATLVAMHGLLDIGWLIGCSALVLLMQAGFLCIESGLTRPKSSINVAAKNLADLFLSLLIFAGLSYGVMFGLSHGGWYGTPGPGPLAADPSDAHATWLLGFFLFQMMFCGTASTIVSGAIAERTRFSVYLLLVGLVSLIVYPLVGHWIWNGADGGETIGWLGKAGFLDFAGSTVVHSTGAWVALGAVLVIGPRRDRFADDGTPNPTRPSNVPLAMLGSFLLLFGWFGFNCGSTLRFQADIALIAVNSVLAAAAGGSAALVISIVRSRGHVFDPMIAANGMLGGLVGITAGCAFVSPIASIVIGLVAGGLVHVGQLLLWRLRIDDVVDAIPVHGLCGAWGTIAVALFITPEALAGTGLSRSALLQTQAVGVAACLALALPATVLLLSCVQRIMPLRVSKSVEKDGLDFAAHGLKSDVQLLTEAIQKQRGELNARRRFELSESSPAAPLAREYNRLVGEFQSSVRDQEHRAAAVMSASPDAIYLLDESGCIVDLNGTALRVFGHDRERAIGSRIGDLLDHQTGRTLAEQIPQVVEPMAPDDRDQPAAGDEEDSVLKTRRKARFVGTAQGVGGRWYPCEITLASATVQSRQLIAAFVQDRSEHQAFIEELNAAVAAAEAANVSKSQFLANMSHEMRTPLNGILGFSDLLTDAETLADVHEFAGTIKSSGQHLLRLIDDILDLSKVESGEYAFDLQDCDPYAMLGEIVSILRVQAIQKGITLDYTVADDVPRHILSDPHRLRQILMNLVGNAIKFTDEGRVDASCRLTASGRSDRQFDLLFVVTDTGIGIPADRLSAIFDPFVQADASTTRRFGGTGLGLSISHRFAKLAGGSIEVTSEVGAGSTFMLTIPLHASPTDAPPNATGNISGKMMGNAPPAAPAAGASPEFDAAVLEALTEATGQPRRSSFGDLIYASQDLTADSPKTSGHSGETTRPSVLVVDDGEANRRLVDLILRRSGYDSTTASDGFEALDAVADRSFDLILMDMQMPGLDGFEATRRLRADGLTTPIVALTASAMQADRDRCLAAGCTEFLSKPVQRDDLLAMVQRVLTKPDIADDKASVTASA